jgi:hypothetical protein
MKLTTLLSVITATLLLSAPFACSQRAGRQPDSLTTFTNLLEQSGFDVSTGAAVAYNRAEIWCQDGLGDESAWYANNERYVIPLVPKPAQASQLDPTFQLQPDEALVFIGLTPPPVRYFSYQPYLFKKAYPDGGARQLFASLGDALNNATIKTIGPTPFNAPVVLIFTPDQETDARIRAALQRAGYQAAIINTLVIPASLLNLGYGDRADQLRIAARTSIWDKQSDADLYTAHPPLTVFRVTPRSPATPNPFPTPPLRVRGTGQTEMDLMNQLDQLRQGIIAAHPGLHATEITPPKPVFDGYHYIQHNMDPLADTRDALYLSAGYMPEYDSTNKLTLAEDEFLVIYGVNHVAMGKATYMNVNIYASETAKLTLGTIDDRDFKNKPAAPYLPAGDPAANLMYAYKVSCSGVPEANCLQLAAPSGCTRLDFKPTTLLGVFTRIYMEPATKVGPTPVEILYDRAIKFSPRP